MPAKHFCKAIDIRAYVSKQEAKARTVKRKAINRKKRLLEMLKWAYKEIDYYCLKCTGHILEKTMLKEKL